MVPLVALASVAVASASGGSPVSGAAVASTATTVPGAGSVTVPTVDLVAAEAATGAPVLTVTPSTDLVTGQVVQVAGAGFLGASGPSTVFVLQCRAGAFGPDDCALNNLLSIQPDATGAFSTPFTVRRTISAGGVPIHCDDAPGTCILAAAVIAEQTVAGSIPLGFDPDAPHPNPTVTVTPHAGLLDGATVSVAGTGFDVPPPISIAECVVGSVYCSAYTYVGEGGGAATTATTNAASTVTTATTLGGPGPGPVGSFTADLKVRLRVRSSDVEVTDCLAVDCEIRVQSYQDPDYDVAVPIGFDPTQPIPPAPIIAVVPDTGLADRQAVTVTGEHFEPGADVSFSLCTVDRSACRYGNDYTTAASDGTFSLPTGVRRQVFRYEAEDTPPTVVDCALVACAIFADSYSESGFSDQARAAVSFDPGLPLAPPPTVHVDPTADLPYRSTVTVTGTGFTPNGFVEGYECVSTPTSGRCFSYTETRADATGAVSFTATARRRILNYDGTLFDCVDAGVVCRFVVSDGDGDSIDTALTFDPNAPVPPPPTIVVTPSTHLDWRQNVAVTGSGFGSGQQLIVSECTPAIAGPGAPFTFTICVGANYNSPVVADADGNISTAFRARKIITNGSNLPIDCSLTPGSCYLQVAAFGIDEGDDAPAQFPLSFEPGTAQPPGPPVTVTPHTGLADGQTIAVSGSEFTPNASIGMTLCRATVQSLADCDTSHSRIVTADASGSFSTPFTVSSHISTPNGAVDCSANPRTCVLGVANIGDYIEFSLTPLQFGDPTPRLSIGDTTVSEHGGPAKLEVLLSAPADRLVRIEYVTHHTSARSGSDYVRKRRHLRFQPGETRHVIRVDLVDDHTKESTETFHVDIEDPDGIAVTDGVGVVTITDDD